MDEPRAPEADAPDAAAPRGGAEPAGDPGPENGAGGEGPGVGSGEGEAGVELPEPVDLLPDAARHLGHPGIPELVEEVGAVARRGNPVAALAGGGSGKELLYALAAAERCDPEAPEVQAMVLSPTPEATERSARALHLLGGPVGLAALAWLPWTEPDGGEAHPFAQLMAGRPDELLPRVEAGRLKLGDLRLLALDGVSALEETGQWPAVEAILDTLPGDAQKLVTDTRGSDRLRELLTRQLGKARRWPPELFAPGGAAVDEGAPALLAAAGGSEEERLDRLADTLRHASDRADADRAVVLCHDGPVAHRVAAALAARGVELTDEAEGPGVAVAWGEDEPRPGGIGVLFGLPLSLERLRWLDDCELPAAVVEAGHADQLRLLARRRGWRVRAVPGRPAPSAEDRIGRYRRRVRERIERRDDAAESLVLEPLVREHGAARVAEALSGLLREGEPGSPEEEKTEEKEERPSGTAPSGPSGRPPRGAAPRGRGGEASGGGGPRKGSRGGTWSRLFVSAGDRDDVGPGDLVGAITGETRVTGDQIGRIEVRESYSLVDVEPGVADEVMEGLTGISIKGREVVARPDRKS